MCIKNDFILEKSAEKYLYGCMKELYDNKGEKKQYKAVINNQKREEKKMWSFIVAILIGGVSGWLAGRIMGVNGSWIINILLGLVGGLVGGLLGSIIGVGATNWIGSILISVVGACILIWAYRTFFKK